MVASLLALVLLSAPYDEGAVLTYEGSLQPVKLDKPNIGKSFELKLIVGPAVDGKTEVYWLLNDSGRDPIPWTERWEKLAWSRQAKAIEGPNPGFMYEHVTGKTRVNVAPPLPLFGNELKAGATWSDGKIQFEVEAGEAVDGHPTWDVTARTLVGRRRTMTLDREDSRVYAVRENVFVGQGEEQLLRYQLVKSEAPDVGALDKTIAAIEAWTALRGEWAAATAEGTPKNLAAAIKAVSGKLPELKKQSAGTPLEAVAEVVAGQLKTADEQKTALGALRTRIVGKPLPKVALKDVANKSWTNELVAGKVTVLHFWSYRDENLREPYGQVGYLDFLARQHPKAQVLGVAVAAETSEQQQGQRTLVRKFRDFMNVSYPILLDDGSLLEKLGDPRKVKQELPLFVVIDSKGNVVEYKAGEYEVKANEGLKELDKVVKQTE